MSYPKCGSAPFNGLGPIGEMTRIPSLIDIDEAESVHHVSSTADYSQQPSMTTSEHHQLITAHFEKEPPENMRKSNFFNFIISMYDNTNHPVEIHRAVFKDFYDTTSNEQEYRNGLIYRLSVLYSDGTLKEEDLYIRLIDATTKMIVPYEGTCKNPDFCRVLLTHELICSRCLQHRSCGNKNDTPSDPIIIDRYRLKFFVKCNQNCLKNAGNPKDSRRKFQVALYSSICIDDSPIACSVSIFVHNNSKHGRRTSSLPIAGDGKPYIIAVYPSEGWTTGGTRLCIVGMNFYEGVEVVFGTLPASCEFLSSHAIAVQTPHSPRPGEVDITLVYKGSQFCINNPGKFLYITPDGNSFDHNFARIERVLRSHEDPENLPKEILLRRAADSLEAFYSFPKCHGTAGPLNHIGPAIYTTNYPRSPALFTPAIFTPQGFTTATKWNSGFTSTSTLVSPTKIDSNYSHIHLGEVACKSVIDGGGSTTSIGSHSSGDETLQQRHQRHEQHQQRQDVDCNTNSTSFFTFSPGIHDAVPHSEIKLEMHNPSDIHDPKSITPGAHLYPVAMPFVQVAAPMQNHQSSPYSAYSMPYNCTEHGSFMGPHVGVDGSNRNSNNNSNNNSNATFVTYSAAAGLANPMMAMNPVFIPPSPGFFIAPTASPGPVPSTPTGPGNSSVFNFNIPPGFVSPSKPIRQVSDVIPTKGNKQATLCSMASETMGPVHGANIVNYPTSGMFAAFPSPNIPTNFIFPSVAPNQQLPVTVQSDAVSTAATKTTSMAQSSESSRLETPAVKRSKIDDCNSDVSD